MRDIIVEAGEVSEVGRDDRYRLIFNSIDQGFCIIEMLFSSSGATDYRFLEVNSAFERQTGMADPIGRTMRSYAPDHEQHWFDTYGRVALTGSPERLTLPAASLSGRWYDVYAFRIDAPEAQHVAILFTDITETEQAKATLARSKAELEAMVETRTDSLLKVMASKQHQEIMSREIGHRLKNILALVQAIVVQTLRSSASMADIKKALLQRIHALGKAHEIFFEGAVESSTIGALAQNATQLHDNAAEGHFEITGPEITVGARAGLMLALMMHELSTNAAKYGALSTPEGRVSLSWTLSEGETPTLTIVWQESGGPAVTPPSSKGFGSRLIEQALAETVHGTTTLEYPVSGVVCRFTAPLSGLTDPETAPTVDADQSH